MEQPLITAVTHSTSEARVTLSGVPDEPGAAARIFTALAEVNINVDMIVQSEPSSDGGRAEISFTLPREDMRAARAALEPLTGDAFAELHSYEEMGKVSIVGAGMRSHPGVAAKVFDVLAREGVNIELIATSPIKISCVIDRDRVPQAVQLLHSAFELSGRHGGRGRAVHRAPDAVARQRERRRRRRRARVSAQSWAKLRIGAPMCEKSALITQKGRGCAILHRLSKSGMTRFANE